MKNIHIIATDKPSRLVIDTIENKLYYQPILHNKTVNVLTQHIYITSDEEIKAEDYFWKPDCNMIFKAEYTPHKGCQKIILTTDQELDNVQAIDDEFLEWFVKNPSCQYGGYKDIDWDKIITLKEEPKQETLEEANWKVIGTKDDTFYNGAKWQQERMYSEEDLKEAFKQSRQAKIFEKDMPPVYENFEEWFEQFKKEDKQ